MPLVRATSKPTPAASSWTFSHHLRRRAAERGISDEAITAVLQDPQVTYTQNLYGPDRQVCQRGELGVVVDLRTHTVVTVLFRHDERWIRHLSAGAAA